MDNRTLRAPDLVQTHAKVVMPMRSVAPCLLVVDGHRAAALRGRVPPQDCANLAPRFGGDVRRMVIVDLDPFLRSRHAHARMATTITTTARVDDTLSIDVSPAIGRVPENGEDGAEIRLDPPHRPYRLAARDASFQSPELARSPRAGAFHQEDAEDLGNAGLDFRVRIEIPAAVTTRNRSGAPSRLFRRRSFRITVDPKQMGGVPCIRRLQIPVATVVGMAADGMTEAEILQALPDLEADDRESSRR